MSVGDSVRAAPPYSTASVEVVRVPGGGPEPDLVAVEEPLEIRIGGRPVAVTMRTPGHDEELALGFCLSEGLRPRGARAADDLAANSVEVDAADFDPGRLQRSFYTSSSCGVCGKGALEAVAVEAPRVESGLRIGAGLAAAL
ncbi:MAG TPA: formate dehydrogenase accessory sulfurtransferase FdhD, partial [Gaiellaceae bacterium]|nr:formate dehydrogenase accessory sulfurtransferase FdhD [Gaiellaceae bacterium]